MVFITIIIALYLIYYGYLKKKSNELEIKQLELEEKRIELEIAKLKVHDN